MLWSADGANASHLLIRLEILPLFQSIQRHVPRNKSNEPEDSNLTWCINVFLPNISLPHVHSKVHGVITPDRTVLQMGWFRRSYNRLQRGGNFSDSSSNPSKLCSLEALIIPILKLSFSNVLKMSITPFLMSLRLIFSVFYTWKKNMVIPFANDTGTVVDSCSKQFSCLCQIRRGLKYGQRVENSWAILSPILRLTKHVLIPISMKSVTLRVWLGWVIQSCQSRQASRVSVILCLRMSGWKGEPYQCMYLLSSRVSPSRSIGLDKFIGTNAAMGSLSI